MRNFRLWLCLMLFAAPILALAQTRSVKGKVTDSKDGTPLVEATVTVVGKPISTKTGSDGSFTLNVPADARQLKISYVGFADKTVAITTGDMEISLAAAAQNLNEVVVTGYTTTRKKDLTGSVASLKAKDFNQGQIAAPDQLLQSKIPGLEVSNTSGQPGVATTVQIRGTTSIRSNNNPLYVVDGVPLDGQTARPNFGLTFGSTPNSNPLLYIDPNVIASIDVLKDASSAAIYGARGANGVIVITTKKGTSGPMKVDVGASYGLNAGYMKRFEILDADQYRAALKKYNQPSALDGGTNTDALKALTQTGFSQNYSVALSGGNETGRFRASFLGSHQDGFIKKSALDKYLATIAGTFWAFDKRLTFDVNLIAGNYAEQLTSVSNTAGSTGNIISSAVSWNPTQPLTTNGLYNFPSNGSGNPLAFNDAYSDRSSVDAFLANASAAYRIMEGLEYKFLSGVNFGNGIRKANIEGWLQGFPGLSGEGVAAVSTAKLLSQTFTHTLNYNKDLTEALSINAVIGYEYFKTNNSGSFISGSGFKTNLDQTTRTGIPYTSIFQNAKTQNPYSTYVNPTAELQSYFGRVVLNYRDRYVFTGSLRADGSSKFGSDNRYGYFPAFGVKWQLSNEDFMKSSNIFDNLGIRASYGVTGNQEFPAGSSQEQFSFSSFSVFGQVVNGNPGLKWESNKSTNIGVDFGVARGKVFGNIDYYKRKTSDILFATSAIQPAPASTTFLNLPSANLINEGVEVGLGAVLMSRQNFNWEVNANIAYNKNDVRNFTDPNTGLDLQVNTAQINGQGVSGTLAQVIANNHPVNVYYLKAFEGYEQNGNQKIAADPAFAGNPNPSTLAGLSTSLRYKDWSLNVNMGGAFGFLIYNNTATSVTNIAGIVQGRNIDLAAYNSAEGVGSGVGASTRFLEKGDYFKMRNLTLGYSIGNIGQYVKAVRAYVSGSNLFVITKFTGFDPEVNIDKSSNSYPSRSIEYVPYPTPRVITFGVNFSL